MNLYPLTYYPQMDGASNNVANFANDSDIPFNLFTYIYYCQNNKVESTPEQFELMYGAI